MLTLRHKIAASLVSLGAVALLATTSCSNYGEGDRCDINNGVSGSDSDCDDNLVCTPAASLGTESDICCPQDRSTATVAPCTVSTSPVGNSGVPEASTDGATDSSSSTDTGSDTGTDSGADTGSASDATSG